MADSEISSCSRDVNDASWIPQVGMEFANEEEAYQFYNRYAREVGFSVRKDRINKRASGVIIARSYVCYKEGFQGNKNDETEHKKPKKNERTGCLAHMMIKITENGRYRVSEFYAMHNHELVPSTDAHMLRSHRPVKERKTSKVKKTVPRMSMIEYLVRRAGGYKQVVLYSVEEAMNQSWSPKINMEFENDEKAYVFYAEYGKKIGFDVRKACVNRRPSGVIVGRTYVCHREGYYCSTTDKSQIERDKLHSSERCGCLARMIIKLQSNGRYRVSEFEPKHNHAFVTARDIHTLKSYREPKKIEASLPSTQLRKSVSTKSKESMKIGDVGAILQYMQEKQTDDPSFYYALKLNEEGQITTVFWADERSKVDYSYFCDAVCLDMTYQTNNYGRPLALFYGVNHHKQIVFFGAALLYDETEESFMWLLQTFKSAMYGKQPSVILTDENECLCSAVASVWENTVHRLCAWHIYHNMVKQLGLVFQGSKMFSCDFNKILYDVEEEDEFYLLWENMLEKYELQDNAWLNKLFENREKWALPYIRDLFCADINNTQRMASLNSKLKSLLSQERDILQYLGQLERLISEHRVAEAKTDCVATQKNIILIIAARMLKQAANLYTPIIFELFQKEFGLSLDYLVHKCGEGDNVHEFKVKSEEHSKEYLVKVDCLNDVITCSCKKFEFVGIQCRHVLKTLDILNVKELPLKYLLKRWKKDAKFGSLRISHVESNLSQEKLHNSLCQIFGLIASKGSDSLEACTFVENQSDQMIDNVQNILSTGPPQEPHFST